jgi:hypothetical protein
MSDETIPYFLLPDGSVVNEVEIGTPGGLIRGVTACELDFLRTAVQELRAALLMQNGTHCIGTLDGGAPCGSLDCSPCRRDFALTITGGAR